MKKCEKCHINWNTKRVTCPFCRSILIDDNKEMNFQEYPKYITPSHPNKLLFKIFLFITIIAIISSVLINLLTLNKDNPSYWSLIVIGSIAFLWVLVFVTIISKNNIALKIILQAVTVGLLLIAIEINTSLPKWWSIRYVLPFIIIAVTMVTTILAIAIPKKAPDFILYIIGISIVGVLPFIIGIITDVNPKWPGIACFTYSVFTIFAIIFFGGKTLKEEIVKKMHL